MVYVLLFCNKLNFHDEYFNIRFMRVFDGHFLQSYLSMASHLNVYFFRITYIVLLAFIIIIIILTSCLLSIID